MKQRLDKELFRRGLVDSRSQAEDSIRRGFISVKGVVVTKPGILVDSNVEIDVIFREKFVSRAGEKLNSVVDLLKIDFRDKVVLDVGSSTGGFTELSLRKGAKKILAVDVGTDQMHEGLRRDNRVELHEKTDIRKFKTNQKIDIVVIDVSFVSLQEILPHILQLVKSHVQIVAMVKPQFEAGTDYKHKGVIKNDFMRRQILKNFEIWAQKYFTIIDKADSKVSGVKGNRERFYVLRILQN